MTRERRHRKNCNDPGDAHELTFCCYHGFPFLKAERTCRWLVQAIEVARRQLNFDLWAYVFMPEHVHLIVHPREVVYDIAVIRRAIKSPVAERAIEHIETNRPEWLERMTRHRGERTERLFWQSGGGYDRNIQEPKTLLSMIEYLHMNPVRRGLAERAEDWQWSSAKWFLRMEEVPLMLDRIPPEWAA